MSLHIDEVQPGDIYNGKTITYKGYSGSLVDLRFSDGSIMTVSADSWLLVSRG